MVTSLLGHKFVSTNLVIILVFNESRRHSSVGVYKCGSITSKICGNEPMSLYDHVWIIIKSVICKESMAKAHM